VHSLGCLQRCPDGLNRRLQARFCLAIGPQGFNAGSVIEQGKLATRLPQTAAQRFGGIGIDVAICIGNYAIGFCTFDSDKP